MVAEGRRFSDQFVEGLKRLSQVDKLWIKRRGIIQISSSGSFYPAAAPDIYAPGKAAGKVRTEILAQDMGPRQIFVNSVFPEPAKTPLMEKEEMERIAQNMNLGRMGKPEDIAGIVASLAGPAGAWIDGQQIIANGEGRI